MKNYEERIKVLNTQLLNTQLLKGECKKYLKNEIAILKKDIDEIDEKNHERNVVTGLSASLIAVTAASAIIGVSILIAGLIASSGGLIAAGAILLVLDGSGVALSSNLTQFSDRINRKETDTKYFHCGYYRYFSKKTEIEVEIQTINRRIKRYFKSNSDDSFANFFQEMSDRKELLKDKDIYELYKVSLNVKYYEEAIKNLKTEILERRPELKDKLEEDFHDQSPQGWNLIQDPDLREVYNKSFSLHQTQNQEMRLRKKLGLTTEKA
ncbi:MAG: hypothetical protein AAGG81_08420 [Chlamydiota bacterium]